MDDRRVQSLIEELDGSVPREDALVRIIQHGGGPDESYAVGNRRGYLRLGIELMRAAYTPIHQGEREALAIDLTYVLDSDADVVVNWLERSEDVGRDRLRSQPVSWREQVVPMAVAAGLLLLGVCTVVGFFTIIRWVVT